VSLTQAFDERDSHYWVTGRCIASLRRSVGESSLEQRPWALALLVQDSGVAARRSKSASTTSTPNA